jgi:hypothetical protein
MCPGVDSASKNEYKVNPGGKGGRCVRLKTYHHTVPLSSNLGALSNPRSLWACMVCYGSVLTLLNCLPDKRLMTTQPFKDCPQSQWRCSYAKLTGLCMIWLWAPQLRDFKMVGGLRRISPSRSFIPLTVDRNWGVQEGKEEEWVLARHFSAKSQLLATTPTPSAWNLLSHIAGDRRKSLSIGNVSRWRREELSLGNQ